MNWKSIIVEDEPAAANLLKTLLRENCPEVKVLAEAGNVTEAVERISMLQPDLVFLDIELGSETVFDALDQLRDFHGHLIFTTGHDGFALLAFRYNAIDYLLKPITPKMLSEVIHRLNSKENGSRRRFDLLRESVQEGRFDRIVLSVADEFQVIPLKEIVRLEGEGNYTKVKLANRENVLTSKPLKFFEETLPETQFFRLHQSHIVHLDFVRKVAKGDENSVLLSNGDSVPISRRRRDEFVVWLAER